MKIFPNGTSRVGVIVLAAIYLFAGSLAGFALAGVLFALANRHGEEHPIAYIYRQSRVCLSCNEMDYKTRRIDA